MRILYLHQYFLPPEANGGTRSYEFARRLISYGHQVRMVTSSAMLPKQHQTFDRPVVETEIATIPTTVIQVPYTNSMNYEDRIRAFLQFAIRSLWVVRRYPADVIFATSTPLTIAIPGIAAKLYHRAPLVFEVRDLWPEVPIIIGALPNPIVRTLARALEWAAYHASSYIVALSPGMAEGVMRRGITPERISVIPNSCDVASFDVPASRGEIMRQRLPGLADGQPLIVYTGTFGKMNGVGYLVEVADAMRTIAPEIRFLLVGAGAERDQVTALARARNVLNHNLWIWEPLPKAEMPDLLAAATVATSVVVPLKAMWDNSANKFFDALAAGKPIAINYGGWQAELLEESGAGVVLPANDPTQAAHDLAALIRDTARLQRAAVAARGLAYTRFSRDLMAQNLESLLLQAACEGKRTVAGVG